jgi:hypothetical protein
MVINWVKYDLNNHFRDKNVLHPNPIHPDRTIEWLVRNFRNVEDLFFLNAQHSSTRGICLDPGATGDPRLGLVLELELGLHKRRRPGGSLSLGRIQPESALPASTHTLMKRKLV